MDLSTFGERRAESMGSRSSPSRCTAQRRHFPANIHRRLQKGGGGFTGAGLSPTFERAFLWECSLCLKARLIPKFTSKRKWNSGPLQLDPRRVELRGAALKRVPSGDFVQLSPGAEGGGVTLRDLTTHSNIPHKNSSHTNKSTRDYLRTTVVSS